MEFALFVCLNMFTAPFNINSRVENITSSIVASVSAAAEKC
jgi:hypothetical protein